MYKIINEKKNILTCRYFNSLSVIDNKILKKAIDDKGRIIIKFEIEWYKNIKNIDYIPKIYEYYEFGYLMEYKLNYIPLYEYLLTLDNLSKELILENVINKLNNLHSMESTMKSKIDYFTDIKKEIYDKVL